MTDVAPSKNAVYDQMELRAPKADPTFTTNATSPKFTQSAAVNYFRATFTGANVTGDNNEYAVTTNVTWTEVSDASGVFSNGTFTAPANGLYFISYNMSPFENNICAYVVYTMRVDGTLRAAIDAKIVNGNIVFGVTLSTLVAIVYLTTGQYVRGYIQAGNDDASKTMSLSGSVYGYRII